MKPLRSAFVGNKTPFNEALCRWLADRTELRLIVWTSRIPWPHRLRSPIARVGRRLLSRVRRQGLWRVVDETAYYVLYVLFLRPREEMRIRRLTGALEALVHAPIDGVPQVRPTSLREPGLWEGLRERHLDVIFATCTDAYLPREVLDTARHGAFLWHEGITPEYRGVYSAFWALYNEDYSRIGYTLLKMSERLDAGPVYVQGPVAGADFQRDWHCYLGVKGVLDSLPHVERFLTDLEEGRHVPIERPVRDGYYSYPTATALWSVALRRWLRGRREWRYPS